MRKTINFAILSLMLVAFVAGIALRGREAHTAPAPIVDSSESAPSASPSATTSVTATASVSGSAEAAPPALALGRPLRVVGLGWDGLAAGVMANDGTEPGTNSTFKKANLDVRIKSKHTAEAVENALARGGKDDAGADIAIMSLQRFVASYERLKALDPVIFFVVAWSDGREVVLSKKKGFAAKGKVSVFGNAGSAAAFVGLFALDLAGTAPDAVTITAEAKKADYAAITRSESKSKSEQVSGDLLLTTAEASRLVPVVAIAQRSLLRKEPEAMNAWARLWLDGHKIVSGDASEAARKLAAVEGGPEPLEVLASLGQLAPASLAENAEVAGLSGRGAVTLEELFQRTWTVWRKAKVLTIPPEKAPVDPSVIATLVRRGGELTAPTAPKGSQERPDTHGEPLLVHHFSKGKLDEEAVIAQAGFLAGVFRRSPIRLTVHPRTLADKKATARAVAQTRERFGLGETRLEAGGMRGLPGSPATIEVMPIP